MLRGAAGVAVALPALEAMGQAAMTPPRRLITVFTANGDQLSRRFTTKGETNFAFDDMLSPFQPYRQDLLVLEGIDKFHGRLPDSERSDGHQQGGSALAPWRSGSGSFAIGGQPGRTIGYVKGPSIDKAIGDAIAATTPNLRFRHLYFRVGDGSNHIWNTHSHNGPEGTQSPIPAETNPFTAYTRIFANVDTTSQQLAQRRLAMRQSALDLVKGELTGLRTKVSSADRARLDLHAESIREVERGLSAMIPNGGACAPMALGTAYDPMQAGRWRDVGNLFFKISAMALACDLTRTINFNWSGNTSDRVYSTIQYGGGSLNEGHHTISHDSSGTAFDKIRLIKKLLFQASTQLHDDLKAVPDGTGKTLWDHTLVMHWSELSQGDTHWNHNNLVVFAGKAHGHFRMGRYLDLGNSQRRGFSNALVSCWQYMGFNRDAWGAPELFAAGTGGLPV
jgi:hypothetical protein